MKCHRPLPLDAETSYKLSKVRQKGTAAEITVRSCLNRLGYRFRISCRGLPGSPDIINRSKKWAIFVHGCFWHHHEGCKRATIPKNNREFWLAKFQQNKDRDAKVTRQLEEMGYKVITIWECETQEAEKLAQKLLQCVPAKH